MSNNSTKYVSKSRSLIAQLASLKLKEAFWGDFLRSVSRTVVVTAVEHLFTISTLVK